MDQPSPLDNTPTKPRSHVWRWVAGIVVALALGSLVSWFSYPQLHNVSAPKSTSTTTSSSTTPTNTTSSTEDVNAKLSLDYVPSPGAGESSQALTIAMTVPTSLRTQITNTTCINGAQGGPAIGNSVLEECLHLSFADKLGSGDSLTSSSSLSLWDAYDWLQRDEYPGQPYYMFNLRTVAQKQQAWQALTSLTPTTDLKAVFNDLPSLAGNAAYVSGAQEFTYVQSADSRLKGVAFIATVAQYGAYDPHVWVLMGGTVGNQPLLLTGSFKASDPTAVQIDNLQQNHQSTEAGNLMAQAAAQLNEGKVSIQTRSAYNSVLPILKSIKISAS